MTSFLPAAHDFAEFLTTYQALMYQPESPIVVIVVEDDFRMGVGLFAILMHWPGIEVHLIRPKQGRMPMIPHSFDIALLDEDLDAEEGKGKPGVSGKEVHDLIARRRPRAVVASISLRNVTPTHVRLHFKGKLAVATGDPEAIGAFIDFMNDLFGEAERRRGKMRQGLKTA